MQGVAVFVGARPEAVWRNLGALECFQPLLSDGVDTKIVHVRFRHQQTKIGEDPDAWHGFLDFGVALISVSGLTPEQVDCCNRVASDGATVCDGASIALWLSGASLPHDMSHLSVCDGAAFTRDAQPQLVEAVESALRKLHSVSHGKKRKRRLNEVSSQLEGLRRGFVSQGVSPDDHKAIGAPNRDVASWLVSGWKQNFQSLLTLRPGLGEPAQDLTTAVSMLLGQLLAKAWEETRLSPGISMRAGNLRPCEAKDRTSKVFVARGKKRTTKGSGKNRLIWVADLGHLQACFARAVSSPSDDFDLESCGVWACVVSEGADQITIEPKVDRLPGSSEPSSRPSKVSAARVVLLYGPDLHRYVLIHNSLQSALRGHVASQTEQAAQGPERVVGTTLLRAWLGLQNADVPAADTVLGDSNVRNAMLDRAEKCLGLEFSRFQRDCILGISKPFTNWNFIAGAGKTQMLVALALMASWFQTESLVCLCAGTNAIAADHEEALLKVLDVKQILRLEVHTEGDEFHDAALSWTAARLEEVMQVEATTLCALDNCVRILSAHIPGLINLDAGDIVSPLRTLIQWLLAVRHNYLDSHVYSRCAELEQSVMEQVKVLVLSGANLNKIHAGHSAWSPWFSKQRLGLFLADEVPRQAVEEMAAQVVRFLAAVLAGDRNQFMSEQRQTSVVSRMGMRAPEKSAQPLNRHSASDWVQSLSQQCPANADSTDGNFQYRYGHDTIRFIKYVFPGEFDSLACPDSFRNTLVLPYFFKEAKHADLWTYSESSEVLTNPEVLRHPHIFAHALTITAAEMVLAEARGPRSGCCQILIMWCLRQPLHMLLSFLDAFLVDACRKFYELWGLEDPPKTYALTYSLPMWMQTSRFQAKAAQNAHGSNTEIALWFLVRRRQNDFGLRGEQTQSAFLFEQCSRATLRQHVFVEDLRSEEMLPDWDPFWTQGWELGLRSDAQYSHYTSESVGKRTLRLLRLFRHLHDALVECHGFSPQEAEQYYFSSRHDVAPVFFRSPRCMDIISAESQVGKQFCDALDPNSVQAFLSECRCFYDRMHWLVECAETNVKDDGCALNVQGQFRAVGEDDRHQWIHHWLQFLDSNESVEPQRKLPRYNPVWDAAEGVDLESWSRIVLPTMNVHLLALDRRTNNPEFERSQSAMHYSNICLPFSTALFPGGWDANELMAKLVTLVLEKYSASSRGEEVAQLGELTMTVGHHKKKQFEYGALRFVVSACASDRPAFVLLFTPHEGNECHKKPIELLHVYVAMGLSKQHYMQQVILCRVRDFQLSQALLDIIHVHLHVPHVSVQALHKDAQERQLIVDVWHETYDPFENTPMPVIGGAIGDVAGEVKCANTISACEPFLRLLTSSCSKMQDLLWEVLGIIRTRQSSEIPAVEASNECQLVSLSPFLSGRKPGPSQEPTIQYVHEALNCRVPPAQILLPGIIQGTLLWGGLSPALNVPWLQWKGVTHVLNCLGSSRIEDNGAMPDPNYQLAVAARSEADGICYIDWCINHMPSRSKYLLTFSKLESVLRNPGGCLYVHCKSGRDRSAATVFALLRLQFALTHDDAWNALQTRVGKNRWPCANLNDKSEIMQWIDSVLCS